MPACNTGVAASDCRQRVMLCAVICSHCRRQPRMFRCPPRTLIDSRLRPYRPVACAAVRSKISSSVDRSFGHECKKRNLEERNACPIQSVKPSRISFGDWPSSQHCLNNRPSDSLSLEVSSCRKCAAPNEAMRSRWHGSRAGWRANQRSEPGMSKPIQSDLASMRSRPQAHLQTGPAHHRQQDRRRRWFAHLPRK